jgi:hypothetical protein
VFVVNINCIFYYQKQDSVTIHIASSSTLPLSFLINFFVVATSLWDTTCNVLVWLY